MTDAPPTLATRWLGRAWRRIDACDSTNDEAARWARAGAPHGAVVVADTQRRGRGRQGRAWHSPVGENLYLSAIVRPPIEPRRVPPLALAVGVAVAEAVETLALAPELKWPNDVLLDGKKLAGILIETSVEGARLGFAVVGIGVNVHARAFPDELAPIATSLALASGRDVDGTAFVAALCASLERWHDRFVRDGIAPVAAAWKARAKILGARVRVTNAASQPITGTAVDLDDDGALLVHADDGKRYRVVAGDVAREA